LARLVPLFVCPLPEAEEQVEVEGEREPALKRKLTHEVAAAIIQFILLPLT
jgi:hypothetical protein